MGPGAIITRALRGILGKAIKGVAKAGKFVGLQKVIPARVQVRMRNFATNMMSNASTARWWGRAIGLVRRNVLRQTGAIGTALKSAGVNNWMSNGMAAFNYDRRSPAEFKKDMDAYDKQIGDLLKRREDAIKKAMYTQNELLKVPLDVTGLQTSEEKLNALANGLNSMKVGIGEIKATQSAMSIRLDGLQGDLQGSSSHIGSSISSSSQQTIQTVLTSTQEVKDFTQAQAAESNQSVVSEITAAIEAAAEQKRQEEEERRKNHWFPKFLDKVLFILEWILDFPFKLKMMLFKLIALAVLGLIAFVVKYWDQIWSGIKWSFNRVLGFFRAWKSWIKALIAGYFLYAFSVLSLIWEGLRWMLNKLKPFGDDLIGESNPVSTWFTEKITMLKENTVGHLKDGRDEMMKDPPKDQDANIKSQENQYVNGLKNGYSPSVSVMPPDTDDKSSGVDEEDEDNKSNEAKVSSSSDFEGNEEASPESLARVNSYSDFRDTSQYNVVSSSASNSVSTNSPVVTSSSNNSETIVNNNMVTKEDLGQISAQISASTKITTHTIGTSSQQTNSIIAAKEQPIVKTDWKQISKQEFNKEDIV